MSKRTIVDTLVALGNEATEHIDSHTWFQRANGFANQPPSYNERWLNSCEKLATDGVPWAKTFLHRYALERLKE